MNTSRLERKYLIITSKILDVYNLSWIPLATNTVQNIFTFKGLKSSTYLIFMRMISDEKCNEMM